VSEASDRGAPSLPRYGSASLSDLTPSILSALGVPGMANRLGIEPLSGACLLVIDGLGWEGLRDHPDEAPFLHALAARGRPIDAGFPATTSVSIASIGTGLPPGRHGLIGYTLGLAGFARPMNLLQWSLLGPGPAVDLRDEVHPETLQPERTAFERAADHGVALSVLGPREHARSGMTRAALRGGRFIGVYSTGDLAAVASSAAGDAPPTFVYAYHPDLDFTGHMRGVASESWSLELASIDRMAEAIFERLPPGVALFVTGDHGMVDVEDPGKLEARDHPELMEGVRLLAGEPRARYAYARPGAEADALAAWREQLADGFWVRGRDEAIAEGWFGPAVPDRIRPRIGDVVAAARGPVGIFQREIEGFMVTLRGHHGSLTDAERLVPLLEARK
jgi:predicted AlkP superfamily pyrophosphatase or phosphodiesterase